MLTLAPGLLRSGGGMQAIDKRPSEAFVALNLQLPAEKAEFASYSASLATAEGHETWRQARLPHDGEMLKVLVPASALTLGDWRVTVAGVASGGESQEIAGYYFRVAVRIDTSASP